MGEGPIRVAMGWGLPRCLFSSLLSSLFRSILHLPSLLASMLKPAVEMPASPSCCPSLAGRLQGCSGPSSLAQTSCSLDPTPLARLRLRSEKRDCQVSLLSRGVDRRSWKESGALGQPCIPRIRLDLEAHLERGTFAFWTLPCLLLPFSELEFLLPEGRVV